MKLGDKIRSARIEKNMTQSSVAGDRITRNMLSAIESGKAYPSLDTLFDIADKLGLPMYYLLSDEIDVSEYRRSELIPVLREAFGKKQHAGCITIAEKIGSIDDEIAYILAYSHFELGVSYAKNGSFVTSEKHLVLAEDYASKTVYNTENIEYRIPLYLSFVKNVNAPLLDFDTNAYETAMVEDADIEFFKYVTNDWEYPYDNLLFRKHATAKLKIKERKYTEAIDILLDIK